MIYTHKMFIRFAAEELVRHSNLNESPEIDESPRADLCPESAEDGGAEDRGEVGDSEYEAILRWGRTCQIRIDRNNFSIWILG